MASTIVVPNPEPCSIDNPVVHSRTDELDIRQANIQQAENLQRAVEILAMGIVRHLKASSRS